MVTLKALSLLCSVVVFSLNELNDYECVIWLRWKAVVSLFKLFAKALVLAMYFFAERVTAIFTNHNYLPYRDSYVGITTHQINQTTSMSASADSQL